MDIEDRIFNSTNLNTGEQLASNTSEGGAAFELSLSPGFVTGATVYAVIVFIVAVIGNSVVIYIVCAREYMRNSTNILIANMAVADILMACIFPYMLKFLYVMTLWFGSFMGTFLCKFLHSSQVLSIACSVINLVFISLDRCIVIWFPLRRIFTNKVLKASLVASWLYSIAFALPLFLMMTNHRDADGKYFCQENWTSPKARNVYTTAFTVCSYIVPLLIITIAYILIAVKLWKRELPGHQTLEYQKKAHETTKKAITMLVTVVVVFALCWFPLQAREMMLIYFPETLKLFPIELDLFLPWIGVLNSAINPCLYVIFSENFRREFGRVLCCIKSDRPDAYLGIPASRATPMTTPIMSRRHLSATNIHDVHETLPLRHLTVNGK